MAFFDWNHDGKNNYVDNAIEMMIIDDIESDKENNTGNQTSEWEVAYSGKKAYSKSSKMVDDQKEVEAEVVIAFCKILIIIVAIFGFVVNFFAIFTGYVNWPGLIICAIILGIVIRNFNKKQKQKYK